MTGAGIQPNEGSAGMADDLCLVRRRSMWRRDAGRTHPEKGRLESIVWIENVGEGIAIHSVNGSFHLDLEGWRIRLAHLGDAEAIAAGWLLRSSGDAAEGRLDGG